VLIDYHTHLERGPYSLEYLSQFVEVGQKRGVSEICFTEHGHFFHESHALINNEWSNGIPRRHLADYIALVEQAKKLDFPVKLGLEMDYVPETINATRAFIAAQPFDFVLGSVHWIDGFGFDNPDTLAQWDTYSVDELYHRYFLLLGQSIESKIFDCVAHPDVIKIFGHRPSFDLAPTYCRIAQMLADNRVCLEVSTAGWRKPVNELYPHVEFLRVCLKAGVNITLASDAHEPAHVGHDFARVVPMLRDLGVQRIATFSARDIKLVNI